MNIIITTNTFTTGKLLYSMVIKVFINLKTVIITIIK